MLSINKCKRFVTFSVIVFVAIIAGCASSPRDPGSSEVDVDRSVKTSNPNPVESLFDSNGPTANINFKLSSVVQVLMEGRLVLLEKETHRQIAMDFPSGEGTWEVPAGSYTALLSAYDRGVPIVVDVRELDLSAGQSRELHAEVLEGVVGNRRLSDFDQDYDQVLDRVEAESGTDPFDASSTPGEERLSWNRSVISNESRWYRGDMHVHSQIGQGTESVKDLVRRAENAGLDFLSIADSGTMDSAFHDDFRSDSVVLIPGMEWGNEETGIALLFAPGTIPRTPSTVEEAQRMVVRIQAQGGIFAVMTPCNPESTWNWGLDYFNAVEAWTGDWRRMPPINLNNIHEQNKKRVDGQLQKSIAIAAATPLMSGNGQSTLFYDLELSRGAKAGLIAGSRSGDPSVPMGSPITYVHAREKSLQGILEGLRMGRTYVSSGPDGPRLEWIADIMGDGKADVSIGGTIPVDVVTRFTVNIRNAQGKRFELLMNGHSAVSTMIKEDNWNFSFNQKPDAYTVYRCRVTEVPTESGYGLVNVLAMTSPIYAEGILLNETPSGVDAWLRIENDRVGAEDPEAFIKYLESQGQEN